MKISQTSESLVTVSRIFKRSLFAFACVIASATFAAAGTPVVWTGIVSTDWGVAANWSPAVVPDNTTDVTIPASPAGARFPAIISGTYAVGTLTISPGATVNQSGGILQETSIFKNYGNFSATGGTFEYMQTAIADTIATGAVTQFFNVVFDSGSNPGLSSTACYLKVAGNWTNNTSADFLSGNTTTVEFNGTANQTMGGVENTVFRSLVINNSTFVIAARSISIIGGILSVSSGTFDLSVNVLSGNIISVTGTGAVQTQNTSATPIPAGLIWPGLVYYNSTSAQTIVGGSYTNLNATGGNRTLSTPGTIKISANFTPGTGIFTYTGSTIDFNGWAPQNIPEFNFENLTISGSGVKTATGAVNVFSELTIRDSASLASNGLVTLKSEAGKTASVAQITSIISPPVSGEVTVERYISAKRAFRFLTVPVNSSASIKANWMENTMNPDNYTISNPFPGYGTNITGNGGNANGFDVTQTSNPSVFTFNNVLQAWAAIPNTNSTLNAGTALRILVRGDRSIQLSSNTSAPTTAILRAKGALVTGNVIMAATGGTTGMPQLAASNTYSLIGNPYASAINWLTVNTTDIAASIYVFDPTLTGLTGRGAYVSYNTILGASSSPSSSVDNYIQSGQGFFIQANGPNPSITFKESDKTSVQRSVFKQVLIPTLSVQLLFQSLQVADAVSVYFSEAYSNSIGNEDSYKFTNQDENLAILRNGVMLSLEGRKLVTGIDSVPLKMWQLRQKNYIFKIELKNAANLDGYLEDKYTGKTIPLSHDETLVPFSISSDAQSFSPERFKIVLKPSTALPVKLTGVKAYERKKGVQVDWVSESESNLTNYEVERSADAQHFMIIGSAKAGNIPSKANKYTYFDIDPFDGDNYYRIKSIEKSGDRKTSEVVKVTIAKRDETITVSPSLVVGSKINLSFVNIGKGTYAVELLSNNGQSVHTSTVVHPGGSLTHSLMLQGQLSSGIYQLKISDSRLKKYVTIAVE